MAPRVRHAAILVTLALVCLAGPTGVAPTASAMVGAPAAHAAVAATFPQPRLPAAGELVETVAVRAAPRRSAPVVRMLHRFRPDHQFQIVLAVARRRAADGEWWYQLSLPGPPNGARGWIPAPVVELRPVVNRIVVRLGARRLEVRRVRDGRVLLRAVAAVGAAGTATPRGRDFYVQSAFIPTDTFYGPFALETSAYARVTDWPTDVVGIHGTNQPQLLGQAVSHGCIRVANGVARRLERLAPLGTPVDIVP
jgi:lipoprotein-anchoring transpeptidase ErfK/SrfK